MKTPEEEDQFRRIELVAKIDRAREHLAQYDQHRADFQHKIEEWKYEIGRLDERL